MQPKVKFMGVYSSKRRKNPLKPVKELFFVWQIKHENETYIHVQEIDGNFATKGKVFAIDDTTFKYFTFEPTILAVPLTRTEDVLSIFKPKKQKPEEPKDGATQSSGQVLREYPWLATKAEEQSLKEEAAQSAAAMIEALIRNDFDQALKQLDDPNSRIRALRYIKSIPEKKDIKTTHKHMMRDFAMILRKKKLYEVALVFAEKTVALAPKDDHAHFNLARIYFLLSRYKEAFDQVSLALSLPHNEEEEVIYRKLLRYVENERQLHSIGSRRL